MLNKQNCTLMRQFLSKVEIALVLILMLVGATWTFNSISDFKNSAKRQQIYQSTLEESSSVVLLRYNLLSYAKNFAAWQAGTIPRIVVQEARDALYKNTIFFPVGFSIDNKKISALIIRTISISDQILSQSQPGFVTRLLSAKEKENSFLFLLGVDSADHSLSILHQSSLDKVRVWLLLRNAESRLQHLIFPILFVSILLALILSLGKNSNRKKRKNKADLDEQFVLLESANRKLHKSQDLVGKLRSIDNQKNSFITTINHEIRTPLTSVIGFAEILKLNNNARLPNKDSMLVDTIYRNSILLLGLVENILELSSLNNDSVELVKSRVGLVHTLKNIIIALGPQLDAAAITVAFKSTPESEIFLFVNENQISRAFSNILANAIKYSESNSKIEIALKKVTTRSNSPRVLISFIDHGTGIPDSEQDSIFTSFYRASNVESSAIPGSGLGLTITRKIIELHDGTINVTSKEGVGTTFIVDLPIGEISPDSAVNQLQNQILQRAILAVESVDIEHLDSILHEISWALGIYDLNDESQATESFCDWPRIDDLNSDVGFVQRKDGVLRQLQLKLLSLKANGEE